MSTGIYTLAVSQVLDMIFWVSTIFKQRTEMSQVEYHILWDAAVAAKLDIQQIQPPITIPLDHVEECSLFVSTVTSDGHGFENPCGFAGTGAGDQIDTRDIPAPVPAGNGYVTGM
jgi:hypothetical protein